MEFFSDFLSNSDNLETILGAAGGIGILSIAGFLPRIGFVSALRLQFKSRFFNKVSPLSVRKPEIDKLLSYLHNSSKGRYICVTGGKGQGKSCLIDTALLGKGGVIKISTQSGADRDEIVDLALREITGLRRNRFYLPDNARRVLAFHNFFFSPPIVVLHVPERLRDRPCASATAAVRSLADDYGLKVIVDCPPNSVPDELFTTKRQRILNIEPMKREVLESIPELNDLIKFLYDHQLADGVWDVLGGSPIKYVNLKKVYRRNSNVEANEIVEAIKNHITSVLHDARNILKHSSSNTKKIMKFFRDNNVSQIPIDSLKSNKLIFDSPNQVLEEVQFGGLFLVPATPSIGIMIQKYLSPEQDSKVVTEKLFAKKSEN